MARAAHRAARCACSRSATSGTNSISGAWGLQGGSASAGMCCSYQAGPCRQGRRTAAVASSGGCGCPPPPARPDTAPTPSTQLAPDPQARPLLTINEISGWLCALPGPTLKATVSLKASSACDCRGPACVRRTRRAARWACSARSSSPTCCWGVQAGQRPKRHGSTMRRAARSAQRVRCSGGRGCAPGGQLAPA